MPKGWLTERDPFSPLNYRYRVNDRIYSRSSAFQKIEVYETDFFGRILVLDGVVQATERDEFIYHEMLVHVPLHSHPGPKRVLVIGGGDGGAVREVLKHSSVLNVVLVELDPDVVNVSNRFFPGMTSGLSSPRVAIEHMDGARFLETTTVTFDAIVIDSPDPIGPAKSLTTGAFFRAAGRVLAQDGVLVMQSESLHFHAPFIVETQKALKKIYPFTDLYGVPLATYAGNWWTFSLAAKRALGRAAVRPVVKGVKLYSEEVHRSCFVPASALRAMVALDPRKAPRATKTPKADKGS